jgi:aryl-alcohol dehydrogenase-like predicted oxidoreductase
MLKRVIEGIIGKALKGRRDNVVLATKAHITMGDAAYEALKPMIGGMRNIMHVRAHWDEITGLYTHTPVQSVRDHPDPAPAASHALLIMVREGRAARGANEFR